MRFIKSYRIFENAITNELKQCFQTLLDDYSFSINTKNSRYYEGIYATELVYDDKSFKILANELVKCLRKIEDLGIKCSLNIAVEYRLYKPDHSGDIERNDFGEVRINGAFSYKSILTTVNNLISTMIKESDFDEIKKYSETPEDFSGERKIILNCIEIKILGY